MGCRTQMCIRDSDYTDPGREWGEIDLPAVLKELLDDACARGVLTDNSVTGRDLLDTALMGLSLIHISP